jgi:antitoxin ParD1/3/4
MATMNISLPDALKDWAETQGAKGKFANMSDFVRDLLREEQERLDYISYVQKAIEEAEASGYTTVDTDDLRREFGLPVQSDAA